MDKTLLAKTAAAMVAKGKGILAADESSGTCETRFKSVGVECTEDSRRAYRGMLFTTTGIEQFVSGAALQRDPVAPKLHADRLARALAHVVNLLGPDVIVLGGGVSNVESLYSMVPPLIARYVYRKEIETPLRRAAHGDASGVRGAAMLWDPGAQAP